MNKRRRFKAHRSRRAKMLRQRTFAQLVQRTNRDIAELATMVPTPIYVNEQAYLALKAAIEDPPDSKGLLRKLVQDAQAMGLY